VSGAGPTDSGGAGDVVHAFSLDVEDYRQILSTRFRGAAGPVTDQLEASMDVALALLAETGTRATFFVTGTVAEGRPDLVRRWAEAGHEIASHGWDHTPIWSQTPAELRAELAREKARLQDALGQEVCGYRAPIFSVRWDTLWALDVIAEAGFAYDSSVVPVRVRRYGVDRFEPSPRRYALPSGREIVEIPMSAARVYGLQVPVSGGGYFRLFSYRRIRRAVADAEAEGRPFVAYCHPYEFGSEPFRAADLARGWRAKALAHMIAIKTNLGRRKVPATVRGLLGEFRFAPLAELADRVRQSGARAALEDAG